MPTSSAPQAGEEPRGVYEVGQWVQIPRIERGFEWSNRRGNAYLYVASGPVSGSNSRNCNGRVLPVCDERKHGRLPVLMIVQSTDQP